MTRWNTTAVVLASWPRGESDLSVQLMTPDRGRINAVAKGALHSRRRFAGLFDLAQLIALGFMTAPRSGRLMIEHAAIVEPFSRFHEDPLRLGRAALLLEITMLGAAELEPAPLVFNTLKQGLKRLHSEPDTDRWAVTHAFRLLAELGYRPGLDGCVRCRGETGLAPRLFNAAAGGVLCPACYEHEQATSPGVASAEKLQVPPDTARTLIEIMKMPEARLTRISFTRNALGQSRRLLELFIAHQLLRPSRALQFMATMEKYSR